MARPRQVLLTRERIVEAAAALVDAEGLEAVSVRRLATELGVQGPSLYNHFATKAEILDAVADAVIAQVDVSPFATFGWQEALRRWAHSYHDVRPGPPPGGAGHGRGRVRRPDRGGLVTGPRHAHRRPDAVPGHRLGARLVRAGLPG